MIEIISIITIGLGIGGTILLAFKLFRKTPPRYIVPLSAGLAMIVFTIWNEYAWFPRTVDQLPSDVIVVRELPASSILFPWTLIVPSVESFIIMDTLKVQRHKTHTDFVMVETGIVSRYSPNKAGLHMFNCALGTRADIGPGTNFDKNGMPIEVTWFKADKEGLMYIRACSQP
ncbi:MAG: hypothetical protein OQK35_03520 [Alphaproteobacteria bacterium]|nr:hypothetical protein [Alphaproteobacteria bacterium]